MRLATGFLLAAATANFAAAQPPQRVGVVTPPGTTARAGPSDQFPDTGVVPAGTRVVVVAIEGDWVTVEPPAGQRSWMPALVLIDPDARPGQPGHDPANGTPWDAVVAPDGPVGVPVLAGDATRPRPLPIQRLTVPAGTIVTVTGAAVEHQRAKWFPVEPPLGDYRYLPKSSVQLTAEPAPQFQVQSPANAGQPIVKSTPEPPAATLASLAPTQEVPKQAPTGERLWVQAEAATEARDFRRAEQLYLECAAAMNHENRRDEAAACFARLHQVRTLAAGTHPAADPRGGWHGPGKLRPTAIRLGDRETFAVQTGAGKTQFYVVAAPGVDLARFRDYQVELFGTTTHRPDLNGVPLVTATRVQQARRR